MAFKTPTELEQIYKAGMATSHEAAIKALYDAGATDALADARAVADAPVKPPVPPAK